MATNNALTAKQQKAIAALVQAPSIAEAARRSGVGQRTLHRWLEKEHFADALSEARRAAWTAALEALQAAGQAAVACLVETLDSDAPAAVKVTASRAILELGYRGKIEEMESRLASLEVASARKGALQ